MTTPSPSPFGCSRCESLPAPPTLVGRMYLWFPLGHTTAKVVPYLTNIGATYSLRPDEGGVAIDLGPDGDDMLLRGLAQLLSLGEQNDTKALHLESDRSPTIADFAAVTTLRAFLAALDSGWLIEMLTARRFDTWFQPIVRADDPSKVVAHEALFRSQDANGAPYDATKVFETGRDAGLLFQLDLEARRSAIAAASKAGLGSSGAIHVNFNPASIYDPAFCLRSTMRAIDEAELPREALAFEVVESERSADRARLSVLLDSYRERGFIVGLDDVGAGQASLGTMTLLRPDYVKFDMSLVRGVDADPVKATVLGMLLGLTRELGIRSVAKGVETRAELAWLQDHGADLVQGFLLGRPAATPAATGLPAIA